MHAHRPVRPPRAGAPELAGNGIRDAEPVRGNGLRSKPIWRQDGNGHTLLLESTAHGDERLGSCRGGTHPKRDQSLRLK